MFYLTNPLFSSLADKQHYLDPGSGSFIIQLIIAGLLGLGILVRSQWGKIKKLFGKKKTKNEETDDEND